MGEILQGGQSENKGIKAIMDSFQQQCGCQNYDNGVAFWFTLEADGKTEEA